MAHIQTTEKKHRSVNEFRSYFWLGILKKRNWNRVDGDIKYKDQVIVNNVEGPNV